MFSRAVLAIAAVGVGRAFASAEVEKVCASSGSCGVDGEELEAVAMKTSLLQLNSRGLANNVEEVAAKEEESDEPETVSKPLCSDSCPPGQCAGLEMCAGCSWCEFSDRSEEMHPEHRAAIAEAPKEVCMSFCTADMCESEPKRCGSCASCVEGTSEDDGVAMISEDDE
eukprot:TRINITY_DN1667_c0_g1_i1.p2 TRINITY_DN1667_c0_g1~~TRINITY_DN1667_c0_g1_i1.p2  ORF type:complete len:169 (-),score=50.75 TRINITY_DN1667_c0_g1_i1:101-607(-)